MLWVVVAVCSAGLILALFLIIRQGDRCSAADVRELHKQVAAARAEAEGDKSRIAKLSAELEQKDLQASVDAQDIRRGMRFQLLANLIAKVQEARVQAKTNGQIITDSYKPLPPSAPGTVVDPSTAKSNSTVQGIRSLAAQDAWKRALSELEEANRQAYADDMLNWDSPPDAWMTVAVPGEDGLLGHERRLALRKTHYMVQSVSNNAGDLLTKMGREREKLRVDLQESVKGRSFVSGQ